MEELRWIWMEREEEVTRIMELFWENRGWFLGKTERCEMWVRREVVRMRLEEDGKEEGWEARDL